MSGIEVNQAQLKKLSSLIKDTPDSLFDKKVLELVALRQKNRIFVRTTGGRDTNSNPFTPYNAAYAKKALKTSVTDVNLTATGNMLNAMTQKATDKQAVISFTNNEAEELASYHDKLGAGKNKVIRKFFGMSESDKDDLFDTYLNETAKRLRKLGYE